MMAEGSRRQGRWGRPLTVGLAVLLTATIVVTLALASDGAKPKKKPKPPQPPNPPALVAPTLTAPTTVEISPTNRVLHLESGRDYVIRMPATPFSVPGGIAIVGGRNVVISGGEIVDETPIGPSESADQAYGLYLEDQTGTVHIEGMWIHGAGIGQALVLDQSLGGTVQVQSSRLVAMHPVGHVHTDGIQTYSGPARLLLRNVTIRTAGVGIQTQPHTFGAIPIDRWEYWRVNVVQMTRNAYALWKGSGQGSWWRETHRELWVRNLGNFAWPSRNHWNPGGPGGVDGEPIKKGLPPRGDFVQASGVGLAYAARRSG